MKYFLIIPRILWKTLFLLNFTVGLILLSPFFYIFLSRKEWFPKAFQLLKCLCYWILIIPGLFVKIKREVPIGKLPKTAIYCANHVSYLDIVISYLVIPKYFISIGKKELETVPILRLFFKNMNITVDRKSISSSHKAFVRAGMELEKGNNFLIFPEGTISSFGKLLPFKNGAFKLAIEKQIPVVPVTFLNNWRFLQNGGFLKAHGSPGICRIVVHKPVSTSGMTENDLVSLRNQVHGIILNELNNYYSDASA